MVSKKISAEAKLKELNITLPTPPAPAANYVTFVRTGNLVFTSGHISTKPNGTRITGRLGKTMTADEGVEAARLVGFSLLATLRTNLGSLDKVKRIVKVTGMLNTNAEFTDHSKVMNGLSDLFVQILGDSGKHVRTSVGMYSLPLGVVLEVEIVAEVE